MSQKRACVALQSGNGPKKEKKTSSTPSNRFMFSRISLFHSTTRHWFYVFKVVFFFCFFILIILKVNKTGACRSTTAAVAPPSSTCRGRMFERTRCRDPPAPEDHLQVAFRAVAKLSWGGEKKQRRNSIACVCVSVCVHLCECEAFVALNILLFTRRWRTLQSAASSLEVTQWGSEDE